MVERKQTQERKKKILRDFDCSWNGMIDEKKRSKILRCETKVEWNEFRLIWFDFWKKPGMLIRFWDSKRRYQFDPDCQICLSWRLSHACVSISRLKSETANGSINRQWSEQRWERGFRASFERITMEKLWLIRE